MRNSTARVWATVGVIAGALTSMPNIAAAADREQPSLPQIADCRVGFDGQFKVGFWTPIWVTVAGDVAGQPLHIVASTIDSDGIQTSVSAEVETSRDSVEGLWTVLLYTKIGRIGAPVHVTLVAEDDTVLDRFDLSPNADRNKASTFRALPATGELIVQLGGPALGSHEAHQQQENEDSAARSVVELTDVDALPSDWFGYDGVDLVILDAANNSLVRRLATVERRFAEFQRWIELGGHLVIFCGGDAAQEMLVEGGPLATLAPGELAEVVRLSETGPLEHFAKSDAPIAGSDRRVAISVPRLTNVDGNIEVYAGRRPSYLPLVVRAARGLGEVAFVGVDLNRPPLADWPGRKAFYQEVLRPYVAALDDEAAEQKLVTRGYNDLSGALRQRLGGFFVGVAPITFPVVAVLAIVYLLVLGPVDYFAVNRWRRPWLAWMTFPLIVLLFGLGALAFADWRRGDAGVRVNRLELVDIDTTTGQARGTFWATLYSPKAEQFDLKLNVDSLAESPDAKFKTLLSWWGLPGVGIGGMSSGTADLAIIDSGYQIAPEFDKVDGVPVLTSATKSFLARWTAPAPKLIDAQLIEENELVAGFIENRTGRPLRNLRLLYNGWAYRLGRLEPGRRVELNDEISPRRVKTIVTQEALGPVNQGPNEANVFVADQATTEQILNLMMFFDAAGGYGFAQLGNRYQAYCDLSRLLDMGRAILVADVPNGGSRLVDADSDQALGNDEDPATVVYRFVLKVNKE